MKAVILAAGDGGRLNAGIPKILLELNKKTILEYHILGLKKLGMEEVIIICGYKKELIEKHIEIKKLRKIIKITLIYNDKYNILENGHSVYCAKNYVNGHFLMLMGDHLIDYQALRELIEKRTSEFTEVVDSKPKYANVEQATKVLINDGMIKESGKKLTNYNALDTGFFIVTLDAFDVLERNKNNGHTEWNECIKEFIKRGLKTFDIKSAFWLGINIPEELESAKSNIKKLSH
jgi:1L-myo-inositol 1-phosphate cytidylyltransferase / CDP-L-myo-inositol myo-inositolphosphotransferase